MDYKSFKHLKLALIINYNFAKRTIIIIIQSINSSFYWERVGWLKNYPHNLQVTTFLQNFEYSQFFRADFHRKWIMYMPGMFFRPILQKKMTAHDLKSLGWQASMLMFKIHKSARGNETSKDIWKYNSNIPGFALIWSVMLTINS